MLQRIRRLEALLSKHRPAVLVLEDTTPGAGRRKRARAEIRLLERLPLRYGVPVERVSRLAVLDTFAPGKSRYEVAVRLAEIFSDLSDRLPWSVKVLDAPA